MLTRNPELVQKFQVHGQDCSVVVSLLVGNVGEHHPRILPAKPENALRQRCITFFANLMINVSPKSIVVSAIESKEDMKRLIDTFKGAISSNGRILLSILPAIK